MNKAWYDGYQTKVQNGSIQECPYQEDSKLRDRWFAGYNRAANLQQQGIEKSQ